MAGGVHCGVEGQIKVDDFASNHGLVKMKTYKLNLYHVERQTFASNFKMSTSLCIWDLCPNCVCPGSIGCPEESDPNDDDGPWLGRTKVVTDTDTCAAAKAANVKARQGSPICHVADIPKTDPNN